MELLYLLPFFLYNVFVDFVYLYEQTVTVYRIIGLHVVGDIIVPQYLEIGYGQFCLILPN